VWLASHRACSISRRVLTFRKGHLIADKNTVKDLLTDEIKDLYSAEKQLIKAIPKMAKGSNDPLS
jgi:hypothetical protein